MTTAGEVLKTSSRLTIVCCANDKFATGLIMSLASCLAQSSGRYEYDLVVLDGGLTQKSKDQLEQVLIDVADKINAVYSIRYIEPNPTLVALLPTRAGTWMTYARFLLADLLKENVVIYLDSDVLCLRGVEEFFECWDGQAAVTAARDPMAFAYKDWPNKSMKVDKSHYYFNAGLILMNLNWFRTHYPLTKIFSLIDEFGMDNLKFHDQTLLNFITHNNSIEVPMENNWVLATENAVEVIDHYFDLNMHYVGRVKPWLRSVTEARRYFAEVLYQRAAQSYGLDTVQNRIIDAQNLRSVKRKAFWYKFIKPNRAKTYQKIIDNLKHSELALKAVDSSCFYRQSE